MATEREPLTEFEQSEARQTVERMKAILVKLGYTVTVDENNGTETITRPDGSVAIVAKKDKKEEKKEDGKKKGKKKEDAPKKEGGR